jgi:8-oxo-dGTP pyrophosphatase MutT (NUDIX family)
MQTLIESLKHYNPSDSQEALDRATMIAFLQSGQNCFARTNPWAHFTGSALLTDRRGTKVLLNHHKSLNCWLQFGGHADGNPEMMDVARRELEEESGLATIEPVLESIFDIAIVAVPYNPMKKESAHLHYDVRYLFRLTTDNEDFTVSDESISMRWCNYDEALKLTGSGSVARMLGKWASGSIDSKTPLLSCANVISP